MRNKVGVSLPKVRIINYVIRYRKVRMICLDDSLPVSANDMFR